MAQGYKYSLLLSDTQTDWKRASLNRGAGEIDLSSKINPDGTTVNTGWAASQGDLKVCTFSFYGLANDSNLGWMEFLEEGEVYEYTWNASYNSVLIASGSLLHFLGYEFDASIPGDSGMTLRFKSTGPYVIGG